MEMQIVFMSLFLIFARQHVRGQRVFLCVSVCVLYLCVCVCPLFVCVFVSVIFGRPLKGFVFYCRLPFAVCFFTLPLKSRKEEKESR